MGESGALSKIISFKLMVIVSLVVGTACSKQHLTGQWGSSSIGNLGTSSGGYNSCAVSDSMNINPISETDALALTRTISAGYQGLDIYVNGTNDGIPITAQFKATMNTTTYSWNPCQPTGVCVAGHTYVRYFSLKDHQTGNTVCTTSALTMTVISGSGSPPMDPAPAGSVDVKTFGAKGDGTSDDSSAIQSAINSLGSGGGSIYFPSGTYMLGTANPSTQFGSYPDGTPVLSAIIVTNPNITLWGATSGGGSYRMATLKLMSHKKLRILSASGNGFKINNLIFDGNKPNRDEGTGWPTADVVDALVIQWMNNDVQVSNVESRNGIEDGIGCWQCQNFTVKGSYLHDNGTIKAGGTGISFSNGINGTFENNTLSGNTAAGLWAAFGDNGVIIKNNNFQNNIGAALALGGQGGTDTNYQIIGNTMTGNGIVAGFPAMAVVGVQNGVISQNTINDNLGGIAFWDPGSTNWNVTGNIISNTTNNHVQKYGISVGAASTGITLTSNTCASNGTGLNDQIKVQNSSSVNSNWQSANTLSYQ